ncbi:MAG: conjugal transfer protein TraF [Proteobacteria bacterium]|nr:conjugal transfer protein TraF [Pseudomonadota bacterium]
MRLSRLSVRFGDITDSEALFDAIRDSNFRNANRLGVDIGALWVADNYQLGVQLTNVNEPKFAFHDIDLDPYQDEGIIGFLQSDQNYTMDRQLKLEASLFTSDRRWSAHLGLDADSATDPMGDDYQWLT